MLASPIPLPAIGTLLSPTPSSLSNSVGGLLVTGSGLTKYLPGMEGREEWLLVSTSYPRSDQQLCPGTCNIDMKRALYAYHYQGQTRNSGWKLSFIQQEDFLRMVLWAKKWWFTKIVTSNITRSLSDSEKNILKDNSVIIPTFLLS